MGIWFEGKVPCILLDHVIDQMAIALYSLPLERSIGLVNLWFMGIYFGMVHTHTIEEEKLVKISSIYPHKTKKYGDMDLLILIKAILLIPIDRY